MKRSIKIQLAKPIDQEGFLLNELEFRRPTALEIIRMSEKGGGLTATPDEVKVMDALQSLVAKLCGILPETLRKVDGGTVNMLMEETIRLCGNLEDGENITVKEPDLSDVVWPEEGDFSSPAIVPTHFNGEIEISPLTGGDVLDQSKNAVRKSVYRAAFSGLVARSGLSKAEVEDLDCEDFMKLQAVLKKFQARRPQRSISWS